MNQVDNAAELLFSQVLNAFRDIDRTPITSSFDGNLKTRVKKKYCGDGRDSVSRES
jgi:hypothetical protein